MIKFEEYLIHEIQNWVRDYDRDKYPASTYAVADLQLAFDNDDMMTQLEKRANFLKKRQFAKANEVELKLTEIKNEKFEMLTIPKLFYCTFHTEYAYTKANEANDMLFLGGHINIQQATEPTDIIWENRHYRKNNRRIRWVFVSIIMIALSFGAFIAIIFLIKRKLLITFQKSPPGVTCDSVIESYSASDLQ